MHHWFVDGLPAGRNASSHYTIGFALGSREYKLPVVDNVQGSSATGERATGPLLYNHYDMTILYHSNGKKTKFRVVGVLVVPRRYICLCVFLLCNSRARPHSVTTTKDGVNDCSSTNLTPLSETNTTQVTYSYSVTWVESRTPWGTRWDHYLYISDEKVHWFSIINSAVIVLLLSGMVSIILLRALHQDISRYNSSDPQEDLVEEFGWKLVHGDVFRPPGWAMVLCVLVGNGAQVGLMSTVTLVIAALGFLSPSSRGSLSTVMLVFYFLFASVAGYVSARLYKMFGGQQWRENVVLTAFLVPGYYTFFASTRVHSNTLQQQVHFHHFPLSQLFPHCR